MFDNCCNLKKIVIPGSLKHVAECAFEGCPSLEEVVFQGSETEWEAIDFGWGNDLLIEAYSRETN